MAEPYLSKLSTICPLLTIDLFIFGHFGQIGRISMIIGNQSIRQKFINPAALSNLSINARNHRGTAVSSWTG